MLLWYRCCYRGKRKAVDNSPNERDFIKIRDGSVANSNPTLARNAFWASHDRFGGSNGQCIHSSHEGFNRLPTEGGVMEGSNCAIAISGGAPEEGVQHPANPCCRQFYSDEYTASACGLCDAAGTMPRHASHLHQQQPFGPHRHNHHHHAQHYPPNHATTLHNHCPYNCSTMRRSDSQSPPHHYHYAYLPDGSGGTGETALPLSTFNYGEAGRQLNEYYDDPSPYATATLVNPAAASSHHGGVDGGGGTMRSQHSSNRSDHGGHPALPLTSVPRRAPSHFLSRTVRSI